MKNMIKLPAVILGLMLLFGGITQKAVAQGYDDISLQSFYDELSPYGTWIQDPQYGNVWRPDVDQQDFRPYYTDGRWAMTEYGNTWVSDYDWGWAPFHYGRWVNNRFNQWVWIPDTVWGPAWVSWRSGGGYYGWAPLGPGINISINIGGGGYNTPSNWWNFIPQRSIYSSNYPRYSSRNITIINRTTIINNTYGRGDRNTYYTGPRAEDVRRATNRDVRVYNVSRSERPGRTSISNNNISIYNPRSGNTSGSRAGNTDRSARNEMNSGRTGNIVDRAGRNDVNSSRTGTIDRATRGDINTSRTSDQRQQRDVQQQQQRQQQDQQQRQQRDVQQLQQRQQQDQQQRQQRDVQQRDAQQQQQRQQQDQQQRQQRDAQQQQQRQQQDQQQRQQRDAQQQQQRQQQDQQQRQQRDAQQQQQRQQQDQQQRQQRDAQQQQQRQQQDQQQRQQRDAQQQQQRQQESAPSRSSGGDAPQRSESSRSGRN
ncbi:hypothetical protein H7F33_20650 [Pedobacter sp. PAMC26386]|nr:hypothetical protein H7F33_20650 [Pedobacter sp. PAMC26386]